MFYSAQPISVKIRSNLFIKAISRKGLVTPAIEQMIAWAIAILSCIEAKSLPKWEALSLKYKNSPEKFLCTFLCARLRIVIKKSLSSK